MGPDGNLWFTEFTMLGRVTPSGVLTEFPIPAAGANPSFMGITTGPDNMLWFTEFNTGRVSRIDPFAVDPAATYDPVVTDLFNAFGITTGPDATVWFTELFGDQSPPREGNALGRITPAGVYTEVPLPFPEKTPAAITTGPDGRLWFTQRDLGSLGTVDPFAADPATTYSEFPVAPPGLQDVVTGPDGLLWFTAPGANSVGRTTVTGDATLDELPNPDSTPRGITVGPDCNLWFTEGFEEEANRIGRIGAGLEPDPAGACVAVPPPGPPVPTPAPPPIELVRRFTG